ncbi:unnamed protein product [Schistocephalus solidus]|uniref:Uncharacterized protein n=1 Tax=Schistocephalus solidus TaxID=70667 RepID=A0A183TLB2_SCHSO|nr:unnamed protein product [Schistocephalus solidus]
MWLLEVGFFPAATPRVTVTTGGLNQVRVSGVVCASMPAINALLVEKNQLHKAYIDRPTAANKTTFYRSRFLVQKGLRQMQDAWMTRKAEEIQGYTDRNEWKYFFAATKAVYGPPVKGKAPLLSADGRTLFTEKTQILTRWAEHFQSVLSQPSTISDAAIDRLPEVEINANLDLPPSLQKTLRAQFAPPILFCICHSLLFGPA